MRRTELQGPQLARGLLAAALSPCDHGTAMSVGRRGLAGSGRRSSIGTCSMAGEGARGSRGDQLR